MDDAKKPKTHRETQISPQSEKVSLSFTGKGVIKMRTCPGEESDWEIIVIERTKTRVKGKQTRRCGCWMDGQQDDSAKGGSGVGGGEGSRGG
jgi:hypothetical protein